MSGKSLSGLSAAPLKGKSLERSRDMGLNTVPTGKYATFSSSSALGTPLLSGTFPAVQNPVTPSTFFIYRTQLSIVSHEILSNLYCAALVGARWSDVQDIIQQIDARLTSWKQNLPTEFDFDRPQSGDVLGLQRTGLEMFYNSSQMILFRPCLCRFNDRALDKFQESKDFNVICVAKCVQAARDVINAFPSINYPLNVYTIAPWWNTIHYLIEAASVLMLELAYRAEHVPALAADLLTDSKKAVMWLRAMAIESITARKGWEIFDGLLRDVAPNVGGTTDDMPDSAPVPSGWRGLRFGYQSQDFRHQERVNQQTAIRAWVDQSRDDHSQYAMQQNFPVTPFDTNPANTRYVSNLQTFNPSGQIYGRYDEFGPWHDMEYEDETYRGPRVMTPNQYMPAAEDTSTTMNSAGHFASYMEDDIADRDGYDQYQN